MRIRVYDWDNGDWTALEVDGALFEEGHSMGDRHWIALLRKAGVEVEEITVPAGDEDAGPADYADLIAGTEE